MTDTAGTAISPIALRQTEGEALWFMGALASIKASSETTDGRVARTIGASRGPGGPPSPRTAGTIGPPAYA
jgi:hypothetical protein